MEQFKIREPGFLETEEIIQNQSSRNVLETILEENSSEEDGIQDIWSTFDENSSDVGSVIQLNSNQDQDAISERDLICPAKRRKHEDMFIFDRIVKMKNLKTDKIDELNTDMKHFDERLRFDDNGFDEHSESDLSFTSISRTSSLTLFESLERQMQSESQNCGSLPSLSTIIQSKTSKPTSHCLDSYEYSSEDSSCNSETRTCVSFGALTSSNFVLLPNQCVENHPYNKLHEKYEHNFNDIEIDIFSSQYKTTSSCNGSSVYFSEDDGNNDRCFDIQTTKRLSASTPNLSHEKLTEYKEFKMLFLKGNNKNSLYVQRIMELNDGANYEYLLMSSVPENLNLCFMNSKINSDITANNAKFKCYNDKNIYNPCNEHNLTKKKRSIKNSWNKKTASYANLTKLNYSDESLIEYKIDVDLESVSWKNKNQTEIEYYVETVPSNFLNNDDNYAIKNGIKSKNIQRKELNRISEDSENLKVFENKLPIANFINDKNLYPVQRLVSSTPNLFQCQVTKNTNEMYLSSEIAANQIYQSLIKLTNQSNETSKNGFSNKEVSFHPIVSEIIWKDNQKKGNENQNIMDKTKVNALMPSSNSKIIDKNESMNDFEDIPKNIYSQIEQISFKTIHDRQANQSDKIEFIQNNEGSFHSYIHPQNLSNTSNEYKKKGFLSRLSSGLRFSIRKKLMKKSKKNNKQSFNEENNASKCVVNQNKIDKNICENISSIFDTENLTNDIHKIDYCPKNKIQQYTNNYETSNKLQGHLDTEFMLSQKCIMNKKNNIELKHPRKICNIMTNENKITGLIETNLDTDETLINGKTQSLVDLGVAVGCSSVYTKNNNNTNNNNSNNNNNHHHHHHHDNIIKSNSDNNHNKNNNSNTNKRIRGRRPHKSMEFLLDKENHCCAMPPENELQKSHDNNTTLSEHQIRVQTSLQKLNIPDWYKQYNKSKHQNGLPSQANGTLKTKHTEIGRWTGLNNKTTSLSSLGSHRSDRSPIILSPSVYSHQGQPGFSRWSTLCLNSNQISPSVSSRSSFSRGALNASNSSYASVTRTKNNVPKNGSIRQPYLGWRSQEKVSQPRTPAERLASTILTDPKNTHSQEPLEVSHEIQSSIKEVTSAIVHYVNDKTKQTRSRSISPNSRIWLESSFVGTRLESPQTPTIPSPTVSQKSCKTKMKKITELTINSKGDENAPIITLTSDRQSTSSIQLEDVLASLLGLPSNSHCSSDNSTLTEPLLKVHVSKSSTRRHSDSNTQNQRSDYNSQRRISFDEANDIQNSIFCRNPRCTTIATYEQAKATFKSCHNCSHLYCSRECRKIHWLEKHRESCLQIYFSVLCRRVISTCKDNSDVLAHLSLFALKGFASSGRGVIRILFRKSDTANKFIKNGFSDPVEPNLTYVRWLDLVPSEMGIELYEELLKISIEYNPFKKMLIYVAVCIISENVNSSKPDRQLVSRCAKLKLCKSIINDLNMSLAT